MKDKSYFLRLDLNSYKPKFKLLCCQQKIEMQLTLLKFANNVNNDYLRKVIDIKEI